MYLFSRHVILSTAGSNGKADVMIAIRRSQERGHASHGWLESYHTFSFAGYQDLAHNGFRALRVINDDVVAAGRGFGPHAHRDMEILSYVLAGKLAHKDSMGNTQYLGPNEIQKMSAGSGVIHSEFNGSESELVHFLQIWIEPGQLSLAPSYEQYKFESSEKQNRWKTLASHTPVEGAVSLTQDAYVYVAALDAAHGIERAIAPGRAAWAHVVKGSVTLNGTLLAAGDAAAITDEGVVQILAGDNGAEIIFFDLA